MGSWIWIAVIAVVIVGVVYFRSRNKSGTGKSMFGGLFAPKADELVERYKTATDREKARGQKLKEVLQAKQLLCQEQAVNAKIQQEIEKTTAHNPGNISITPAKVSHRHLTN